ncbi:MAG: hypothetical protein WC356_00440 [Candidatus Micrarchaeia archaeon]|jgi:hypothetical protein
MEYHSKAIERIMKELGYSVPPSFETKKPLLSLRECFSAKINNKRILFKVTYIFEANTLHICGVLSDNNKNEKIINKFGFAGCSELPFVFTVDDCLIKLILEGDNRLSATIRKRIGETEVENTLKTEDDFIKFINNNIEPIICERLEVDSYERMSEC